MILLIVAMIDGREAIKPELVDLPVGLGELLGREGLPKVRKVPGQELYSLADVGGAITGKDARHAAQDLSIAISRFPEMAQRMGHLIFKAPILRSKPVEVRVGDLPVVVEYIMLLPGELRRREEIAEMIVCYFGGTPDIVRAVLQSLPVRRPPNITDTDAITPEMVALPAGLGELLGRDKLPAVRKAPGRELYSLADVGRALLGKPVNEAGEDLRRVISKFPDLQARCLMVKFTATRRQPVDVKVGDLPLVVEYIMLLPGKTAARIRAEAAKLLVRFLGGDETLLDEVREMRHVQEHLKEVDPTDWRRAFGEAVECASTELAPSPPPAPFEPLAEFHEAGHLVGARHHYAFQSQTYVTLWKSGSSDDPWRRAKEEDRKHGGRLKLQVRAIWWNEAYLEHAARERLKRMPPPEMDVKGTEYRITSLDEIVEAMNAARKQTRALADANSTRVDEAGEEREFKRRRTEVEVATLEMELKRAEQELELGKRDRELAQRRAEQELELAKKRAELELKWYENQMALSSS